MQTTRWLPTLKQLEAVESEWLEDLGTNGYVNHAVFMHRTPASLLIRTETGHETFYRLGKPITGRGDIL